MSANALTSYLTGRDPQQIDPGFVGYLANLSKVASVAPSVAANIVSELADQRCEAFGQRLGHRGVIRAQTSTSSSSVCNRWGVKGLVR